MKIDVSGFSQIPVQRMLDHSMSDYHAPFGDPLSIFRRISPAERKENEAKLDQKMQDLEQEITLLFEDQKLPSADFSKLSETERFHLKRLITRFLLELDGSRLLFDQPFLAFFIREGYLDTAEEFILRGGKEETSLSHEEIFQALRNVWIMNSLQIYWSLPLEVTPSVYAYSLLYPYTDNFLDDPAVQIQAKQDFNRFMTDRLMGFTPSPQNLHEEKAASLLAQIEGQYPREDDPPVWQSLLLIQKGQVESLRQSSEALGARDLLTLSFLKGGSSVLADAFLVKGTLMADEQNFAFSYGAFLQLLDDFQDIREDRKDGYMTLFSRKDPEECLDAEILTLIAFIVKCNASEINDSKNMSFMKEVIVSCTLMMVMAAAAKLPERVSSGLYGRLQEVSKVSLPYYLHLEERLSRMIQGLT